METGHIRTFLGCFAIKHVRFELLYFAAVARFSGGQKFDGCQSWADALTVSWEENGFTNVLGTG